MSHKTIEDCIKHYTELIQQGMSPEAANKLAFGEHANAVDEEIKEIERETQEPDEKQPE